MKDIIIAQQRILDLAPDAPMGERHILKRAYFGRLQSTPARW
jgi:hypothetical protein